MDGVSAAWGMARRRATEGSGRTRRRRTRGLFLTLRRRTRCWPRRCISRRGKGKAKEVELKQEEKGETSTILVCAWCLDPLLARSDGVTDDGEERRKVWGLR